MPLRVDISTPWSSDEFMIAAMRLLLALSGLLIIYIDPSEPDCYVALTYSTLVFYVVYSAILYILALRHSLLLQSVRTIAHWVDVGWYTLLIALSSGTNSVFFFGFYFSILVASFRWGFASGLRVTLVSTVLFTTVGFKTAPEPAFELSRFLLRPTFLLVLGYMVARWGGFEIMLNRTISSIMAQLRAFYDADACLLVQLNKSTGHVRRVDRRDPEAAMPAEPIPEGLARILGALPPEQALVYGCEPRIWGWWPRAHDYGYAVAKGERTAGRQDPPEESGTLATVLDCQSFVTVPLRFYGETISRLYLIAQRRHAFQMSDVDFLLQVSEHIMPILDNIRLVDQLASGAAEEERRRIARDLHDSVIQPYIGLQIGLAAVRQKLAAGGAEVASDIERLIEMTSVGVSAHLSAWLSSSFHLKVKGVRSCNRASST